MHVPLMACAGAHCQETWGDAQWAGINYDLWLIKEEHVFQLRICCLLPSLLVCSAEFAWSNCVFMMVSRGFLDKTKA